MGHVGATIDPMSTKEPIKIIREAITKAIRDCGVEGFDLDRIPCALDYGRYELTLRLTDEQLEQVVPVHEPKPESAKRRDDYRKAFVAGLDSVLLRSLPTMTQTLASHMNYYTTALLNAGVECHVLATAPGRLRLNIVGDPGDHLDSIAAEFRRQLPPAHTGDVIWASPGTPGKYVGALDVREFIRKAVAEQCAPTSAEPCPDCAHTTHPGEYVGALERGVCLTCNGSKTV